MIIELCAESVDSALIGERGGACRIELCADLAEGGITPSAGQIVEARRRLGIRLYPIIRPRGGDFCYGAAEFDVMRRDVRFCGEAGCDGVVIGMLHPDGTVDRPRCAELISIAREFGMGVTFHRAFDVAADPDTALEEVIALGCERILTSGGQPTAFEGTEMIRRLVDRAAGRITIMPGAGVTPENATRIIARTGCTELHGTFRSRSDNGVWCADLAKIRKVAMLNVEC